MSVITQESNLVDELIKLYGPLLTQRDLATIFKRSLGGFRFSLCKATTPIMIMLKKCGRKIGRSIYYPTDVVAKIILEYGE